MNKINQQLKQLALEAQQYPAKTKQRQKALTKLLRAIQQSGQLVRPHPRDFQGFYDEIYTEALQRLFFHICAKIDNYDPQREVLQWVNFLLNKRFFVEASRTIMPTLPKGVNPKKIKRLTIDDLDNKSLIEANSQDNLSLFQEVFQCLETDPEGIFQGTYISKNPAANFQFLAIKILSGYSWKEISAELGIKIPTLSSFYQRCLTKFAPKFKEYLTS